MRYYFWLQIFLAFSIASRIAISFGFSSDNLDSSIFGDTQSNSIFRVFNSDFLNFELLPRIIFFSCDFPV